MCFTSVANLASLAARFPKESKVALELLCRCLRSHLAHHSGYECEEHSGGFLLAFNCTKAAAHWATTVQVGRSLSFRPSTLKLLFASSAKVPAESCISVCVFVCVTETEIARLGGGLLRVGYACLCVCLFVCVCVCACVICLLTCVCVCVYTYACVYAFMCAFILLLFISVASCLVRVCKYAFCVCE